MSDKVVSLSGNIIYGKKEAVEDAVEQLQNLLERAKSGHLRAVATIEVRADGHFYTNWAHDGTAGSQHAMAAGHLRLGWMFGRSFSDHEEVESETDTSA